VYDWVRKALATGLSVVKYHMLDTRESIRFPSHGSEFAQGVTETFSDDEWNREVTVDGTV